MAGLLTFPRRERAVPQCFTDGTVFHWRANKFGVVTNIDAVWTLLTGQEFCDMANMGFLDVIHEDDRERVARFWYRALSTGTKFKCKYRLLLLSGEYTEVFAEAEPQWCGTGSLNCWQGTVRVNARILRSVVNMR